MNDAKQLRFNVTDYPELDGLESGTPVRLKCDAVIERQEGGEAVVNITQCEIESEGVADREFRSMRRQDTVADAAPAGVNGDDF